MAKLPPQGLPPLSHRAAWDKALRGKPVDEAAILILASLNYYVPPATLGDTATLADALTAWAKHGKHERDWECQQGAACQCNTRNHARGCAYSNLQLSPTG